MSPEYEKLGNYVKKHNVNIDIAAFNISKEDYQDLNLKEFTGVPSFLLYTAPGKYIIFDYGNDKPTAGDMA